MRGTFDYKKDAYPFGVVFVGEDIAVTNHLTGELFEREAREATSEERVAQANRLEGAAVQRKREALQAKYKAEASALASA